MWTHWNLVISFDSPLKYNSLFSSLTLYTDIPCYTDESTDSTVMTKLKNLLRKLYSFLISDCRPHLLILAPSQATALMDQFTQPTQNKPCHPILILGHNSSCYNIWQHYTKQPI